MRNLTGYLKKILLLSSLLSLLTPVIFPQKILAKENFKVYVNFQHQIDISQIKTEATLQINSDKTRVLSFYTASIPLRNLDVKCSRIDNSPISCTPYHRTSVTDVLIDLKNTVISPNRPLEVRLTYSIPKEDSLFYNISSKIADTTTNEIYVKYPISKGKPLSTSEPIKDILISKDNYILLLKNSKHDELSVLFGKRLTYKFNITRVFSNQGNTEPQTFEIIVPTDNSTQEIIWENITPKPHSSFVDDDGNYTLKYILQPNETVDCKISGNIKKRKAEQKLSKPAPIYSKEIGYWNITDTSEKKHIISFLVDKGLEVMKSSDNVAQLTPEQRTLFYKYIYQYVINRLSYPKDLQLGISNSPRIGGNSIISVPTKASPIDYADFYIAILRKFNIPAKMVVGYVSNISGYTSDGFYHHWVTYYDQDKQRWVEADPFLEEYTRNSLFESDFTDHITILTRGKSPLFPTITFFSPNDFTVALDTNSNLQSDFSLKSELRFDKYDVTKKYAIGYIYILNDGNIAVSDFSLINSNIGNIRKYIDPVVNTSTQIILPKESSKIQINIPFTELLTHNVTLTTKYSNNSGNSKQETIKAEIDKSIPVQLQVLVKTLSATLFALFLLLVYSIVKKFNHRKRWIAK